MVESFSGLVIRCNCLVSGWGMVIVMFCDWICGFVKVLVRLLIVLYGMWVVLRVWS